MDETEEFTLMQEEQVKEGFKEGWRWNPPRWNPPRWNPPRIDFDKIRRDIENAGSS